MEEKVVDSLLLPNFSPQMSQDGLETKYKPADSAPSDTSPVHQWIQKYQGIPEVDDEGLGQTSSEISHSQTNSLFDSEDDFSLGADAKVLWDSSYTTDESYDDLSVDPSSSLSSPCAVDDTKKRKLGWISLGNSFDSCCTDLSSISNSSRDVTELLFQREADPEEILFNLGFGSLDLSTRVPNRFLSSASGAKGIDVEIIKEECDISGYNELSSSSCTSPVWSDQGTCRIPARFLLAPKRAPDVAQGDCGNMVPVICEPEDIPEDSFDLMRHLRLNRNQRKNNTGGFLEPVTEELEVSSVGSGSVRTKISRKPSEETLCAGLAGFAQDSSQAIAKMAAELCSDVISSALSELQEEEQALNGSDSVVGCCDVVFNLEGDSENEEAAGGCDVNSDCVGLWLPCTDQSACENTAQIIPCASGQSSVPAKSHLSILGTSVQDSFELEEIVTDEGDCCQDESSLTTEMVDSSRKKVIRRDNSGDSSGFDEELVCEKGVGSSQGLLGAEPSETSSETTSNPEGKSPRTTFAQRRSRSLIKQRPVDSEDEMPLETPCSRDSSTDTFTTCEEELASKPEELNETGDDREPPRNDYTKNLECLSNESVFGSSESFPAAVRESNEVSSEIEEGMKGLLAVGFSTGVDLAAEDSLAYEKDSNEPAGIAGADLECFEDSAQETSRNDQETSSTVKRTKVFKPDCCPDETPVCNVRCEVQAADSPHTSCTSEATHSKLCDKALGLKESNREKPKSFKISRSLSLKEALEGLKELCGCINRSKSREKWTGLKSKETPWSVTKQRAGTTEVGNLTTPVDPVRDTQLSLGDGDVLCVDEAKTMDFSDRDYTASKVIVKEDNSELRTSAELKVMQAVAEGNETKRGSDSQALPLREVTRTVAVSQRCIQEMDVMKQRMEEYRACLKALQSVSEAKELYFTNEMMARLGNDVSNVQGMRSMLLRELDVTQKLLTESMSLPQAPSPEELHFSELAEKMHDLLQEQTSLRKDMSTLVSDMSTREKISTRAWCETEMAKIRIDVKDLKETCVQEIRQEIRASLTREVREYFHRTDRLYQELEAKDAIIKDLTERLQKHEGS